MILCNNCGEEIDHIEARTDATQEVTAETTEQSWEIDHDWISYVCPNCSEPIDGIDNWDDAVEYMKTPAGIEDQKVFGAPKREKSLVKALANMASNFGGSSFSGSPGFDTEQKFRIAASKALKDVGYEYKEYPSVAADGDGWYLKKKE